jgi:hypothetical protein
VDAGVKLARDVGLRPVTTAGTGADGIPVIRHPVDFSATPPRYPLPPPALDQQGDQIRAWLAAPPGPPPWRSGAGPDSAPQRGTTP